MRKCLQGRTLGNILAVGMSRSIPSLSSGCSPCQQPAGKRARLAGTILGSEYRRQIKWSHCLMLPKWPLSTRNVD